MFCKECGAEIPDDSIHCKECGAKLVDDTPAIQQSEIVEKESFFKKNKKVLIGCCIGVFIIFLAVAFITNDSHTTGFREIYTGYYGDLSDMGYDGYMKDKNDTSYFTTYKKDNTKVNIQIDEGDDVDSWLLPESYPMTINGIDGYYTPFNDSNFFIYTDNNCTVIMSSESMKDIDSVVKDY